MFTRWRWLIGRWKQHIARDSRGRNGVINCGGKNSICDRLSTLVRRGRTADPCRFACGWTSKDSRLDANLAICAETTTWREGRRKERWSGEEGARSKGYLPLN